VDEAVVAAAGEAAAVEDGERLHVVRVPQL
jgi:hypothetical protein